MEKERGTNLFNIEDVKSDIPVILSSGYSQVEVSDNILHNQHRLTVLTYLRMPVPERIEGLGYIR